MKNIIAKLSLIKGWLILTFSIIVVFIVLPTILYINYQHNTNLETRGIELNAEVIEINGTERKPYVVFEYSVNNKVYVNRRMDSSKNLKIGETISIVCDSLEPNTVKITTGY